MAVTDGYKPVILVHGLLDGPGQFRNLINFITEVGAAMNVLLLCTYCYQGLFKEEGEYDPPFDMPDSKLANVLLTPK